MCHIVFNFEENRSNVAGWFGKLASILQCRNSFSTLSRISLRRRVEKNSVFE